MTRRSPTPSTLTAPAPRLRSSRELGERVRELRSARGLTQGELSEGRCTKEYVSQIERGKARPTPETLTWLAERLGVDVLYLESGVSSTDFARSETLVAQAEAHLAAKRYEETVAALEPFAPLPEAPELELRALLAESWARMYLGELKEAVSLLESARELTATAGFGPLEQAEVLFRLGCCRYKLSSVALAVGLLTEALALAESSGLPCDRLRADVLGWRSRCHRLQRDWVSARDDVERALELSDSLGDPELRANTLFQASRIAEREGNWLRARKLAEQAKGLYEQLEDRINFGRQLNNLGGLNFLLGDPGKATAYLTDAYAVALETGSAPDAAQAICSLSEVELSVGEAARAEEHARAALELLDGRTDFLEVIGSAQLRLGKSLLEQRRLDEAERSFAAAEATLAQLSSASHVAAAWSAQGELALQRGDDRHAALLYRRAAESLQDYRF